MVSHYVIMKSSVIHLRSDSRNWPRSSECAKQVDCSTAHALALSIRALTGSQTYLLRLSIAKLNQNQSNPRYVWLIMNSQHSILVRGKPIRNSSANSVNQKLAEAVPNEVNRHRYLYRDNGSIAVQATCAGYRDISAPSKLGPWQSRPLTN